MDNKDNKNNQTNKWNWARRAGMGVLISALGLTIATGAWTGYELQQMNDSTFDIELMQRDEMAEYSKYVLTIARDYYGQYKKGNITAEEYQRLTSDLNSRRMLYDYARALNNEDINRMLDERENQKRDLQNRNNATIASLMGVGAAGFVVNRIAQKKN